MRILNCVMSEVFSSSSNVKTSNHYISDMGRRKNLPISLVTGMSFLTLTLSCPQTKRRSNDDLMYSGCVPRKPENHLVKSGLLSVFILFEARQSRDLHWYLESEKNPFLLTSSAYQLAVWHLCMD